MPIAHVTIPMDGAGRLGLRKCLVDDANIDTSISRARSAYLRDLQNDFFSRWARSMRQLPRKLDANGGSKRHVWFDA